MQDSSLLDFSALVLRYACRCDQDSERAVADPAGTEAKSSSNATTSVRCRRKPAIKVKAPGFCDALIAFGHFLERHDTRIHNGFLVADANEINHNAIHFADHVARVHSKILDKVSFQAELVGNIGRFVSVITDGIKVGIHKCDDTLFSCLAGGSMVVFGLSLLGLATFFFPTLFHAAAAAHALLWSLALPLVTGLMEAIFENLCNYVIQTRFGPVIDIIAVARAIKGRVAKMAASVSSFALFVRNATHQSFQEMQPRLQRFSNFLDDVVADPNWYSQIFIAHVQNFINRQIDYVNNLAERLVQTPEVALEWAQVAFSDAIRTMSGAFEAGVSHVRQQLNLQNGACIQTTWGEYALVVKTSPAFTVIPSHTEASQQPCEMSKEDVAQVLPWDEAQGQPCCLPQGTWITILERASIEKQAQRQGKSGRWPSPPAGGPRAFVVGCAPAGWLVQIPFWRDAQVCIRASTPGGAGWECPLGDEGKWCRSY